MLKLERARHIPAEDCLQGLCVLGFDREGTWNRDIVQRNSLVKRNGGPTDPGSFVVDESGKRLGTLQGER